MKEEVLARDFDLGFSGNSDDVVMHAIHLLGNCVTITNTSRNNEFFITPSTTIPAVFELNFYSNGVLHVFIKEAIIGMCWDLLSKVFLVTREIEVSARPHNPVPLSASVHVYPNTNYFKVNLFFVYGMFPLDFFSTILYLSWKYLCIGHCCGQGTIRVLSQHGQTCALVMNIFMRFCFNLMVIGHKWNSGEFCLYSSIACIMFDWF